MKIIACFGSANGKVGDRCYDAMLRVGGLLVKQGFTVATGGFGGTGGEAAARGAKEAGGVAIGYTMLGKEPNQFITQAIRCEALGPAFSPHDPVEDQFGRRLGKLLSADGFIISAAGGPETMAGLMVIVHLNHDIWREKPRRFTVLDVRKKRKRDEGWDDRMLTRLMLWGLWHDNVTSLFCFSHTPERAVDWVTG